MTILSHVRSIVNKNVTNSSYLYFLRNKLVRPERKENEEEYKQRRIVERDESVQVRWISQAVEFTKELATWVVGRSVSVPRATWHMHGWADEKLFGKSPHARHRPSIIQRVSQQVSIAIRG